jgi:hypothetical protein
MRVAIALAILMGTTCSAFADSGPVVVIPGRVGIPVIINGVDASYSVVEGDWGLGKGIHPQPTVYGGRYVDPEPHVGHYYPSEGRMPGYGRYEIEPPANRKLPQPAEDYYRSWSAQSAPPAKPDVPQNPPPVIVAPQSNEPMAPQGRMAPPQDFGTPKLQKFPQ